MCVGRGGWRGREWDGHACRCSLHASPHCFLCLQSFYFPRATHSPSARRGSVDKGVGAGAGGSVLLLKDSSGASGRRQSVSGAASGVVGTGGGGGSVGVLPRLLTVEEVKESYDYDSFYAPRMLFTREALRCAPASPMFCEPALACTRSGLPCVHMPLCVLNMCRCVHVCVRVCVCCGYIHQRPHARAAHHTMHPSPPSVCVSTHANLLNVVVVCVVPVTARGAISSACGCPCSCV